jgi:solute:Na+ symporter, SSS family
MTPALVAIMAYVLVQFAIGAYVSRRIASDTDYILAGRGLSLPLVTFSVFATFFGSEALTATAALVYDKGLAGALVDPFCYGIAMIVAGVFFAGRMRAAELTTFADLFRNRFSPAVEKLVVLVLLPGSLFWAAAQIRVFGVVLNSNSGIGLGQALLIAALVVMLYSVVGGLLADSITDLIQGVIVIAGLLVLGAAVHTAMSATGGVLATLPADRLTVIAADLTWLQMLEKMAVPLCGTIVAVELISRFLGAKSAHVAATGTAIGGLLYIVFGLIPVYLGLAGATLLPGLTDTEELVPKLAAQYLPPLLHALFLGAIVSAVLSTVHATLHAPAAQVAHNVFLRMLPGLSARQKLWCVRAAVAAMSVVAYGLAATAETIKDLVETASAIGSAGVFVALLFGLFSRFGGAASAVASILVGSVAWSWGKFMWGMQTPYLLALGLAAIAYVGVAWIDPSGRSVLDTRD